MVCNWLRSWLARPRRIRNSGRAPRQVTLALESLEARETPATLVNPTTVTYIDAGGNTVTVKTSKPMFTAVNVNDVFKFNIGSVNGVNNLFQQLETVNLTTVGASGTDLSITGVPTKGIGGDGHVNVGAIVATNINLGNVTISGDLGSIMVGNGPKNSPALASLTVQSLGRYGFSTQDPANPSDLCVINGPLGKLAVKSDVLGTDFITIGGSTSNIGSITIGGSVLGNGFTLFGGDIASAGDIGTVTIGGDIRGNDGIGSGEIDAQGKIGSVTVGGNLIGGSDDNAGAIAAGGGIGQITINGSIRGGTGVNSGQINAGGSVAGVTVGGSLIGGAGDSSGAIKSGGNMGQVKINGAIRGGFGPHSGYIFANGKLAGLTVGQSIVGGTGDFGGSVACGSDMGSVTIGGSIVGGAGQGTGEIAPVGVLAGIKVNGSILGGTGQYSGRVFCSNAIDSVFVGGSVVGNPTSLAANNGQVAAGGGIPGGFQIGGSVIGGAADYSGDLFASSDVGASQVGGNIVGGSATGESGWLACGGTLTSLQVGGSLEASPGTYNGSINATLGIGNIKIGGDILGTSEDGTAAGTIDAGKGGINNIEIDGSIIAVSNNFGTGPAILAERKIGSMLVKGSIDGTESTRVTIAMGGELNTVNGDSGLALGSLTVLGRVEFANILAGWQDDTHAFNADAQIGSVHVGGDWIASNLVAGATPGAGGWGTATNTKITGGLDDPKSFSKIASVTIDGQMLGDTAGGSHFGFIAEEIDSLKIGGFAIPLTPGMNNDHFNIGATGDVDAWEIA